MNEKPNLEFITNLSRFKPAADMDLDQVHMRPEFIVAQLAHLEKYVRGRDVALLGDDDFFSVPIAKYLQPKSVSVFELDERILESLDKARQEYSLDIALQPYDARTEVPREFRNKHNFFMTNPPYGSMNKGASISYFIQRCLDLSTPTTNGCFIAPFTPSLPWSIQNFPYIERFLEKTGCEIIETKLDAHRYFHGDENLVSSSFIVKRLRETGFRENFEGIELY